MNSSALHALHAGKPDEAWRESDLAETLLHIVVVVVV